MFGEQVQFTAEENRVALALVNACEDDRCVFVTVIAKQMSLHRDVVRPSDTQACHNERSQSRTCRTEPTAESRAGSQLLWRRDTCTTLAPRHSTCWSAGGQLPFGLAAIGR